MANIIKENETAELLENNTPTASGEDIKALLEERTAVNNETLQFMDEIISFIEKLANNINEM